jgi:hypothetical protein
MKAKLALAISFTLAFSLVAPSAQAATTKPSAPTVASVTSSKANNGKVNVKVTITLPSKTGGSKILESRVTGDGKTCVIKGTKTSCTLKGIKAGKSFSIKASSKNKKGFGTKSAAVRHSAGGSAYPLAALTSTFSTPTSKSSGYSVQVTNYNSAFIYAVTATLGSVSINGTGLVTVDGLGTNQASTATITTSRAGYANGSATISATSLRAVLTPTFGTKTATATGFTVQISNYDALYTWAGTATASGSVAINGSGLVTVTGVAASTSSTATITTTRTGYVGGSATTAETSLSTLTPTFGTQTRTAGGFTVQISNYDAAWTWAGSATSSGTVAINVTTGLVTVTGVAANTASTATITTTRTGWSVGTAGSTATSLEAALTPTFGTQTRTLGGFTVQISNYNAAWTWAGTATASGSVAINGSGLVTVTGVAANTASTATITTTQTGYVGGSATATETSLSII